MAVFYSILCRYSLHLIVYSILFRLSSAVHGAFIFTTLSPKLSPKLGDNLNRVFTQFIVVLSPVTEVGGNTIAPTPKTADRIAPSQVASASRLASPFTTALVLCRNVMCSLRAFFRSLIKFKLSLTPEHLTCI